MVAVCVAISLMLQNKHFNGWYYDVKSIKDEAYKRAVVYLQEEGFSQYVSMSPCWHTNLKQRCLKVDSTS